MSRICELCGKKPMSGNAVSHSKRHTKRLFSPNLVFKRFGSQRKRICTACLRTLKKPERMKAAEAKAAEATVAVEPKVETTKVAKK